MKNVVAITLIVAFGVLNVRAANEVITNFKDPTISCDYLIVAPRAFQTPAVMLAQHRNAFKNDDVEQAKVAFLEDIITAFPGTDYNHRNMALWNGLKWAKQNWRMSFKYIVLIGTDAFSAFASLGFVDSIYSNGLMPTWYFPQTSVGTDNYQGFPVNVTDDYYTRLSYAASTDSILEINDTGICIGRIPAQSPQQCSLYVEKVKRFDLSRPKGPWRNTVMAIADDAMQGANIDPLFTEHQESAEIVDSTLQGYLVRKRYLSAYPADEFYEKPLARAAIMQTINQGAAWAYFFGHGNAQQLTDENVLNSNNTDLFTNDSMPFVFVVFTSENGSIQSTVPVPMCQKFLFMPQGGAIAYVGSANETYAADNEQLGKVFFSEFKQYPGRSLGELFAKTKLQLSGSSNDETYFFLGDPALRATCGSINFVATAVPDSAPTAVRISVPGDSSSYINYSVSFTVRDSVNPDPGSGFPPSVGFSFDSSIAIRSGVFQHSVDVPLPQAPQSAQKAVVYIWNDSVDGRAEILVGTGASNAVSQILARKETPGKPVLSRIRGALVVANLQPGINQIRIFDIRGRIVYSGETGPNTRSVTINLADRNICSGRYVLQLRNQTSQTVLPFVHVAGD